MDRFSTCPDELLLSIVLHLDRHDLRALALTARRYRGVAQEALVTDITLKYGDYEFALPLLLTTLVERPEFALKIQIIHSGLPPLSRSCFLETDRESVTSWRKVTRQGRALTQQWQNVTMYRWIHLIRNGDIRACVGLLILLATQLKHLWLGCRFRFEELFSQEGLGNALSPSAVPGLRRITYLFTEAPLLDEERLLSLPQLENLEISCIRPYNVWPQMSTINTGITSLTVHNTSDMAIPGSNMIGLYSFLGGFQGLRSLSLMLTNLQRKFSYCPNCPGCQDCLPDWYSILTKERPGSFSFMLEELALVAPLLEELKVASMDPYGDARVNVSAPVDYLKPVDYLVPVDSMKQFTNLKRLSIPQCAFINTTAILDAPSPHPLVALPPNLEFLGVYNSTPAVVDWLSDTVKGDGGKLRPLKKVLLYFENDPKQQVADYRVAEGEGGRRLFEAGVLVDCQCRTFTRPAWSDGV
ncbi:hypothetical protein BDW02DRAFT_616298 [Decorospora gaudefroyi]|uniref:F-box domain-containing protein n=1 Tax=Decorospora gaudefroyi TaxID=184978 RepID=A0A6A5KKJ5_9PLEO|nr:hypothetical protein BDW02DRAFT_616298 [Decorospora gaudefroyi]